MVVEVVPTPVQLTQAPYSSLFVVADAYPASIPVVPQAVSSALAL